MNCLSLFENNFSLLLESDDETDEAFLLFLSTLPIIERTRLPRMRFNLSSFSDEECRKLFRFTRLQLEELVVAFQLPHVLIIKSRHKALAIEGFCIFLRRMAYPSRNFDLIQLFGRSSTALSLLFS